MSSAAREEVTRILQSTAHGNGEEPRVADRLFELVYEELHTIAARLMRRERPGHTLRPTALVHEAYLRLVDPDRIEWVDRTHFLRTAARAMRQILVDHARKRLTARRGGKHLRVTLDEGIDGAEDDAFEIIALEDALTRLARLSDRVCHIVELRVFAGMNMDEIAHVLVISRRTAYDDWDLAKRWLARELRDGQT